jgi:hypothetical protein
VGSVVTPCLALDLAPDCVLFGFQPGIGTKIRASVSIELLLWAKRHSSRCMIALSESERIKATDMPSARRWWWGVFPSAVTLSALSGAGLARMADYSSHVNDRMVARHAEGAGTSGGAACGTAADCSHAGVCTDGKCECDMAWTGPSCEVLDLRPAKPTGGFNAAVAYGECADVRTCKSCVVTLRALHHTCSTDLRVDLWRPCSRM